MPVPRSRPKAVALAAGAALLLLPAAGQAAQTFGSRLINDPNSSGGCDLLGACTLVSFIHPSDPNGDPYSGGAPVDGVITRFRIRAYAPATPTQVTFRVADISIPDPMDTLTAIATAAGTGPTVTIPADDGTDVPIAEVGGRLPVRRGQHLALDDTTVNAVYASSGSRFTYVFAPPLVDGQAARGSTNVTEELLVAATIEPDADHDGFGDETQDVCPSQAATQGTCRADTTPPPPGTLTLRSLRVRRGRISYTLSGRATVKLRLARRAAGRRVNGRCVRPTASNRRRPHCKRFVAVGRAFAGPGATGANELALPKPGGRRLRAGTYRLTATARDAGGRRVSATTRFTVVPIRRVATL